MQFLQASSGRFARELHITWALLRDNATAHLGNAVACLTARLVASPLAPIQYLEIIPPFALATIAFAYVFDIANQITSIEEDAINKPFRPIPAGLLTKEEASRRWFLSWSLPAIAVLCISGRDAAVYLVIWVALHYAWPRFNHWVMRNAFTAVGVTIQLKLLDAVISHAVPTIQMVPHLDVLLFLWFALTIHIQEFHDVEGDRQQKRQTLPLILPPKAVDLLRAGTGLLIITEACESSTWSLQLFWPLAW
ncbi:hypothetical protein N7537_002131 [Penicillium hordei]|uniref:UbiA prenyltransferase family-domain-containing protein n=1 Tax=Penicillium hordei TaxID=40994 RepID=A0AAD6EGR5_9EURO|nr:uncharacterized protein N7537_002131 [Penicillium hordei]KAJ5617017.1 hypothetical protein N7537_002131 [Penicillium hordei]